MKQLLLLFDLHWGTVRHHYIDLIKSSNLRNTLGRQSFCVVRYMLWFHTKRAGLFLWTLCNEVKRKALCCKRILTRSSNAPSLSGRILSILPGFSEKLNSGIFQFPSWCRPKCISSSASNITVAANYYFLIKTFPAGSWCNSCPYYVL